MAKLAAKLLAKDSSRRWLLFLKLSVDFGLRFYLIYGLGSLWGNFVGTHEIPLLFAFENQIPFVPQMAWIYLSISLMMGISPLVLDERGLFDLNHILRRDLYCAGICFLIYPSNCSSLILQAKEQAHDSSAFLLADFLNLENNMFPSLHVAFAVSVALVLCRNQKLWMRCALLSWMFAIALSTLLLHQHRLLDVMSGGALGVLCCVVRRKEKLSGGVLQEEQ